MTKNKLPTDSPAASGIAARPTTTSAIPENVQAALLTTAQAAALAGVGVRTWWRWTHSGLAPRPVKIGLGPRAAVRFRRDEILTWITDGCPPIKVMAK